MTPNALTDNAPTRKTYVLHLGIALLIAGCITAGLVALSGPGKQESRPAPAAAAPAADKPNPAHEFQALSSELEKKPKHAPILFRMAQLSREMGKIPDAIAQLRQVLEVDPKNADAHLELGRALYETNDVPGAIDQTKQVLVVDPKNVDALYNLGAIYANLQRDDLAREYWARAVAAGPDTESGKRSREAIQKLGPALPASFTGKAPAPPVLAK